PPEPRSTPKPPEIPPTARSRRSRAGSVLVHGRVFGIRAQFVGVAAAEIRSARLPVDPCEELAYGHGIEALVGNSREHRRRRLDRRSVDRMHEHDRAGASLRLHPAHRLLRVLVLPVAGIDVPDPALVPGTDRTSPRERALLVAPPPRSALSGPLPSQPRRPPPRPRAGGPGACAGGLSSPPWGGRTRPCLSEGQPG